MTYPFVTQFVTHFPVCDAAKGGLRRKCGPKYEGRIVCDAPKATRSRFVTQFVTQGPQPIGPIIRRILARCAAEPTP